MAFEILMVICYLIVILRRRSTRVGVRLVLLKPKLLRILLTLLTPMLLKPRPLLPLKKRNKSRLWMNTWLRRLTSL